MQNIAGSSLAVAKYADEALNKNYVTFQKRVFNTAKVSDHHAIIPTGQIVNLPKSDKSRDQKEKIYDMVVKRFIAVFFPHAEFELTKRTTIIDHGSEKDHFLTNGKILVTPGWLAVHGRKPGVAAGKDDLVAAQTGEVAEATDVRVEDKATNPPARYTESTLLSAMEGAGKLLDDDDLREAMSERGLGTPATRASIIEKLIRQKYVARNGSDMHVTGNGLRLISLLEEMEIQPLISPSMTGEWEAKLRQMERGDLPRNAFMNEIIGFTEDVVKKARSHYEEKILSLIHI